MSIRRICETAGYLAVLVAGSRHIIADEVMTAKPAMPYPIFIGQPVQPGAEGQWAGAEGIVTFVGRHGDGINLEVSSGAGHMQVTVCRPRTCRD